MIIYPLLVLLILVIFRVVQTFSFNLDCSIQNLTYFHYHDVYFGVSVEEFFIDVVMF